jgi:hypothetical protein
MKPWVESLAELRKIRLRRVVVHLRLFLGVEVVEVAEELVEAVHGGQEPVLVAQVILAELAGRVPVVLEQLGDGRVLRLQADRRGRNADLRQAGAEPALPGKKRRTASGARLLAVGVGEPHTLVGDPVDIRRPVAHQAVAVATQVRDTDVVTPDDEDVRLVQHAFTSLSRGRLAHPRLNARRLMDFTRHG